MKTTAKDVTFVIKLMHGGGAERVVSVLSRALLEKGYTVRLILTHQSLQNAYLQGVDERVSVHSIEDDIRKEGTPRVSCAWRMAVSRVQSKFSRLFLRRESDRALITKYAVRNDAKVRCLRRYFQDHQDGVIIAFLNDSMFLSLLAAKGLGNRVILSERSAPERAATGKTTQAFIKRMYPKASAMVVQSFDVGEWYRQRAGIDGTVIFNPVKAGLPEPFESERARTVVNFCRISTEKNLHLLIDAFEAFSAEYPAYELYIYGDANEGGEAYLAEVKERIAAMVHPEAVHLLPARQDIHDVIRDAGMFVSSSDFEGMSNSMLEAMAMGIPTVCTDCPAGGARAIIKDHENGLLVPVGNVDALCCAMTEIATSPVLSKTLSQNALKIRDELTVDKIVEQWEAVIHG